MMNKKTKILFYSGHCETIGGDAKYLFDLINNIKHDEYEIELCTDKSHLFEERAKECLSKKVLIRYLDTRPILFRKNCVRDQWLWRIAAKVLKIISLTKIRHGIHNALIFYHIFKGKDKEIDIFHFNNGGYPAKTAGLIAIVVAYFCGIKRTIVTVHSVPVKRKWYKISDFIFDVLISRYCKMIIADSENIKNELSSRRRISSAKIITIPCGLPDVEPYSKEQSLHIKKRLNLKLDAPILLIVGNISDEQKGHAVLFKSLIEVKNKYPDITLLVVGDGEKKRELMTLSSCYNLDDNIRFLGYRKDIPEINSMIDIAIVPSIDFEAIPYTIKDAMRAGKPVIAANTGGCKEAVEDKINGLLVPPKNAKMLTEAILQLLGDEALRLKMGSAGRELFLKRFLLSDKIIKHENIYRLLLVE